MEALAYIVIACLIFLAVYMLGWWAIEFWRDRLYEAEARRIHFRKEQKP